MSLSASVSPSRHMSVDQYLTSERQSAVRHEYLAGEVFAMSGAGARHNSVLARVFAEMARHLRGSPLQLLSADMKVRIKTHMREYFYYPDLMVITDADQSEGQRLSFVRSPRLIAEVISPSTENIDRREKALMYREIAALEEYALIASEKCEVTVYRRQLDWRPILCNTLAQVAELRSIDLSLPLTRIYLGPADESACEPNTAVRESQVRRQP